jgi:hypothetical protein
MLIFFYDLIPQQVSCKWYLNDSDFNNTHSYVSSINHSLAYSSLYYCLSLLLRSFPESLDIPVPSHVVLIFKGFPSYLKLRIKSAFLELNDRPDLMRKFVSAIFVRLDERSSEEHLKLPDKRTRGKRSEG